MWTSHLNTLLGSFADYDYIVGVYKVKSLYNGNRYIDITIHVTMIDLYMAVQKKHGDETVDWDRHNE